MFLSSPTVSIIVYAYTESGYLSATIDSILRQTFPNWEILIFDRNCNRVNRWLKLDRDSRFHFIWQKNAGIPQTFNQGVLRAKGKYICLLKAGDLWHPDKLCQQTSCLDRYPETGLVGSWSVLIDRFGRFGTIQKCNYLGWVEPEILKRNQLTLASVMLRRSCFERVGLLDSQLSASPDWDFWIRLSHYYQFMVIPQILNCHRQPDRNQQNWTIIETDLHITLEKAYAKTPAESLGFKFRSYAHASLYLARYILQQEGDLAIALNYCHQSREHYPPIGLTREYWRIRLKIAVLYCFQPAPNEYVLSFIQTLGTRLTKTIDRLQEYRLVLGNGITREIVILLGKQRRAKRQRKE